MSDGFCTPNPQPQLQRRSSACVWRGQLGTKKTARLTRSFSMFQAGPSNHVDLLHICLLSPSLWLEPIFLLDDTPSYVQFILKKPWNTIGAPRLSPSRSERSDLRSSRRADTSPLRVVGHQTFKVVTSNLQQRNN